MHTMARNWREVHLESADRALCDLATKLTRHQHEMSPEDLDALREHGHNDRAIHDAVQVIGYFNYITRVADGLGVEPEVFVESWGL